SDVINVQYQDTAIPIDSKTIKLNIPANNGVQVHMLSNIQDINIVMPIQEARVIMNARTGSVVINKEVKLGSCAVSHKNLSVIINNEIPLNFLNNLNINTKKDLS
ncbi:MAG: flagellar basal body P-ring protein FlgI, partial [Buchnera aphidicola]|nr:flagellar basal body P-ring protein FlgI [Buchnera aphidicola]